MSGPDRDQRAKIRRGPANPPRRRAQPPKPRAKRGPSTAAQAVAALPLPLAKLRRIGNWALVALLAGGVIAGVLAMRLPQLIGIELGEAVGRMGFAVRTIEVKGIDRMDRGAVFMVAADQQSRAMPLVDLQETRAKLLRFGWIADARVSRRLPDTLVIDIVERKPSAVWQDRGRLALIDGDGRVIAPVKPEDLPDLPLVIGPGANRQATALAGLMDNAPALKPVLAGATWVGARRWDIRFLSGETLALPEGDKAATDALTYFAAQDQKVRLLGRGFVRFDLRDPRQMVVRVSKEPGHSVAAEAEKRKAEAEAAAKVSAESI